MEFHGVPWRGFGSQPYESSLSVPVFLLGSPWISMVNVRIVSEHLSRDLESQLADIVTAQLS
jgi:hypothetical protein